MRTLLILIAGVIIGFVAMNVSSARSEGEVNVYSYRQPQLVQPLQ